MDLSRFITTKYWFDPSPSTEIHNLKVWVVLFSAISLFGALTLLNKFLFPKLRKKMASFLITTGLVALLLLSFRFEGAYLLSVRLLFLVLLIVAIIWFINILVYLTKGYPKELKQIAEYKKFNSYLPKKKFKK